VTTAVTLDTQEKTLGGRICCAIIKPHLFRRNSGTTTSSSTGAPSKLTDLCDTRRREARRTSIAIKVENSSQSIVPSPSVSATNYDQADPNTGPGTVETVGDVEEDENSAAAAESGTGGPGPDDETGTAFAGDSDDEGASGSDAAMEAWVESPLDTTALFFVPRVLPAFWHNLSKNITELGSIMASELSSPPRLPIPVIVLYIAPHTRCLPSPRENLDSYQPPWYRAHQPGRSRKGHDGPPRYTLAPCGLRVLLIQMSELGEPTWSPGLRSVRDRDDP
jgi:hypothetical protein